MLSSSVTDKNHRAPLLICASKKSNAKKDVEMKKKVHLLNFGNGKKDELFLAGIQCEIV